MYFLELLEYEFVRQAFLAGSFIAVSAGIASVFVVLRRSLFFVHAIGHISITGAAFGVIYSFGALLGQLLINSLAAIGFASLDQKGKNYDLSVGMMLNFFLGAGVYLVSQLQYGKLGNILFQGSIHFSSHQHHFLGPDVATSIIRQSQSYLGRNSRSI